MRTGHRYRDFNAQPDLTPLLTGWALYLLCGVVLIISYDWRYRSPAIVGALVLSLLIDIGFGVWLLRRLHPLTLAELASRLFFLAFGGSFLAMQLYFVAEHRFVFDLLGLHANIWHCWMCPGVLDQAWSSLVVATILATGAVLLTPVSWFLHRNLRAGL